MNLRLDLSRLNIVHLTLIIFTLKQKSRKDSLPGKKFLFKDGLEGNDERKVKNANNQLKMEMIKMCSSNIS